MHRRGEESDHANLTEPSPSSALTFIEGQREGVHHGVAHRHAPEKATDPGKTFLSPPPALTLTLKGRAKGGQNHGVANRHAPGTATNPGTTFLSPPSSSSHTHLKGKGKGVVLRTDMRLEKPDPGTTSPNHSGVSSTLLPAFALLLEMLACVQSLARLAKLASLCK